MVNASDPALSKGDLLRRVDDLERAVLLLAAARNNAGSLGSQIVVNSSAGGGQPGFTVLHDDGTPLVKIGREDGGFGPVDKLVFYSLDGTILFECQSNLFGFENWHLADGNGDALVSMEANTVGVKGQGLARPYIPGAFYTVATPTDTTASGSFTTLQKAIWTKQHKAIQTTVEVQVTATTGEIQWRINTGPDSGTIIHGPVTKSGNSLDSYGPFLVPGAHLSRFEIELQGRVASGAGLVRVRTQDAIGREP